MAERNADIVIYGAGIAGLWTFHQLKRAGYDALLLENNAIGSGQTIASQGIIHSGLKYTLAGKVNELAQSISAMPQVWRDCLDGHGPVDLSTARSASSSQHLLIPPGLVGNIIKRATETVFGNSVYEISKEEWPKNVKQSGFDGTIIHMDELVLDIPSVIKALAEPYKNCIRQPGEDINAKLYIHTAAASNETIAQKNNHDQGLETQARPLVIGLMKNAPFELYAHLVGKSDKPVATITTHKTKDRSLIWYIGGSVAEREKKSEPADVYKNTKEALNKYMPDLDLSDTKWAVLPIDRIEGKSNTQNWMPDTPTIHAKNNHLYGWPTKLTFAPLLAKMIEEHISFEPSGHESDWSFLPEVNYTETPWDTATWTKENSD